MLRCLVFLSILLVEMLCTCTTHADVKAMEASNSSSEWREDEIMDEAGPITKKQRANKKTSRFSFVCH